LLAAVVLFAATFLVFPVWARAQAEAPTPAAVAGAEENLVNIEATDIPLRAVLNMLARAAGVNIVTADGLDRNVTVTLNSVKLEDALKAIVQAAHCYVGKIGDIYMVSQEPVVLPDAPAPPNPTPGVAPPGPPAPAPTPTVLPQPTVDQVRPPSVDSVRPTRPKPKPGEITTQIIPLKFVSAARLAYLFGGTVTSQTDPAGGYLQPPSLTPGGSGYHAASQSNVGPAAYFGPLAATGDRGRSFAESFGQFGGGGGGLGGGGGRGGLGGGGGGLGGGGGGLGGGGRGGLGGGGGGGLGGGLGGGGQGGGLAGLLPEGMQPPVAFLDDNSLIVRGTPQDIDQLQEIVSLLDKPAKQVEISVKFISITTTYEDAFGIDWSVANGALQIFHQGFAPPQASNTVIRWAKGNIDAQLNALLKSSRATVINEPRVAVTNNYFAEVQFGTEIPIVIAHVTYNQFGQRQVDYEYDSIPVENYLQVLPRVNADDSVTLMLTPQISNVTGFVNAPDGQQLPIVTYQSVYTQLRVNDGETVVLGGLISKNDSTTKLNTPLLSKIPIIGKLFDSRDKSLNDTELLIFVTPRVLHDAAAS
jgi:general secretion pathway protein D